MDDSSGITAGAAALSTSSILTSLIVHLKRKGVLTEADEREICELALTLRHLLTQAYCLIRPGGVMFR